MALISKLELLALLCRSLRGARVRAGQDEFPMFPHGAIHKPSGYSDCRAKLLL